MTPNPHRSQSPYLAWLLGFAVCVGGMVAPLSAQVRAKEATAQDVLDAIRLGKSYLGRQQNDDGSWTLSVEGRIARADFKIGVTSIAMLALLNSGMPLEDPKIQKGLKFLRSQVREPDPDWVYEVALMAMALQAANDGQHDYVRIQKLANKLEKAQRKNGPHRGSWGYTVSGKERGQWEGDRSNAQYAILGLHAAAEAGVHIKRSTWELAREHWINNQQADGGWNYTAHSNFPNQRTTGSMTAAGIASLVITEAHLHDPKDDETPAENRFVAACSKKTNPSKKPLAWMARHEIIGRHPRNTERILYFAYGVERAGRLSARRFFGKQDWYRGWASYFVAKQNRIRNAGSWVGLGPYEKDPVLGTSFVLLFLSKGLSPVLIQKLMYGEPEDTQTVKTENWNRHPSDIKRLTEHVSKLPKWPKLVTWQVLNLNQAVDNFKINQQNKKDALAEIRQAPVLSISGDATYQFTKEEATLLRAYVDQGGFILGLANCPENSNDFETSFRDLIKLMYPQGEATLQPLTKEHLVFRSEYPLKGEEFDLHGVDVGCRTAIMFSRDDLGCLWNMIETPKPSERSEKLDKRIDHDTKMGVNIVAYATGREPPNKLETDDAPPMLNEQNKIERGFLQIAKLKHTGGWDVAREPLKNLLMGLNQSVGEMASTKDKAIDATAKDIYKYPLVYMHGRTGFSISEAGIKSLRQHLDRGGVLFADACCSSRPFDLSFRDLALKLYPQGKLKRIPISHEIFNNKMLPAITTVKRRVPELINPDDPLNATVQSVEPYLEGVEVDGRFVVIYSKYDISCALERQTSAACAGYVPDDALKIAINVVMYALLQNANYVEDLKGK